MSAQKAWRQVRIFTSDFSDQWFLGMLGTFILPFADRFPNTPFWFTRYTDTDGADTDLARIPARFKHPAAGIYFSMRFRFCPLGQEEEVLKTLFPDPATGAHWYSGFLPYCALSEFGGSRFCMATNDAARIRRTNRIVDVLHRNCLFVLDVLVNANNAWNFEQNGDKSNSFGKTPFQSVVHLMTQIMGPNGTEPLPLFWYDKTTGQLISAALT